MKNKTNWKFQYYVFAGVWVAYTILFGSLAIIVSVFAWDVSVPVELPSHIWAIGLLGMMLKYSIMGFMAYYSYNQWKNEEKVKV